MRVDHNLHVLKCWPEAFEAIWIGTKTFDIRLDDRGFEVGDTIDLHEYNPTTKTYTGRMLKRRITYITNWNQKPMYVVIGIAP